MLNSIRTADPKTFNSVLGNTALGKEIASGGSWGKRVLSPQESALVSQLLNSKSGQSVQDKLVQNEIKNYTDKASQLGIKNDSAQAYFADLYNQSPARATEIAKRSDGSLLSLHRLALSDPIMGKYESRRNKTYQSLV